MPNPDGHPPLSPWLEDFLRRVERPPARARRDLGDPDRDPDE